MKTYTVYHIPGIKFGCTDNLKRRSKANIKRYGDVKIDTILVTSDIEEASEFEEFCNQEAGYKTQDTRTYVEMVEMIKSIDYSNRKTRAGAVLSQETRDLIGKAHKGKTISQKQRDENSKDVADRVWVNNGEHSKRPHSKDVDSFLARGYVLGRLEKTNYKTKR